MEFEQEQRQALHLLQGIENGTLKTGDVAHLIDESDPALVYLIVTWLREHYRGGHAAAEGVIGRIVEVTDRYPSVKAKMSEGKEDSVVTWFEENHTYRHFGATEFISVIVEKLEG